MFGQSGLFTSVGGGGNYQFDSFVFDSINDKLYVSGQFTKLNKTVSIKYQAVWDGVKWDSLKHLLADSGAIQFQKINNEIYCYGSSLFKLNSSTGTWNKIVSNVKWAGGTGSITRLSSYQNKLIIIGVYDSINNQPIKFISSFDGSSYQPLGNEPFSGAITTAVEFQGKLYLGGVFAFNATCGVIYRLCVWDGSCWKQFGNGIQGSFSGVSKLIVYKNKLYIGGAFTTANGNPGNCLFSYDGVNYDNLGGGFMGTNESVADMFIYKDKLIITGPDLSNLPNTTIQASNFFSFDGNDFCNYFTHQPALNRFGVIGAYHDTLIFTVATTTVGSDTVYNFAKYRGNFIPQYCVNAVGIEDFNPQKKIKIYPNPVSNTLFISTETNEIDSSEIEITNCLGQIILKSSFAKEIDVSRLNSGCYFLLIKNGRENLNYKFIKE